jgi:uncharacterized RDD family membrane protein YckC
MRKFVLRIERILTSQNLENNGDVSNRELTVDTLRSPPLRIPPASLRRRFGAVAIDSIIIALTWQLTEYLFRLPLNPTLSVAVFLAGSAFVYYFIFEWCLSATIGKLVMKLRVIGADGNPCTMQASAIRNLLRFIDWLPVFYVFGTILPLYILGAIILVTSKKRQRIGDRIAHTIVTNAPENDKNPPPAPFLFH